MHGINMMEKAGEINNATILTMLAGLLVGSVDSQAGSALLFGGAAAGQQAMINYTRENEYEADRIGIGLLSDARFDPQGMVEFFGIMGQLSGSSGFGGIEYLRTHPLSNNRVAEAINRAKSLPAGANQVDDFLLFKDYLRYVSSDHLPQQGSEYLRALASIQARSLSRVAAFTTRSARTARTRSQGTLANIGSSSIKKPGLTPVPNSREPCCLQSRSSSSAHFA